MKEIVCMLDTKVCDLDKRERKCRHKKQGTWQGKCYLRQERSRQAHSPPHKP